MLTLLNTRLIRLLPRNEKTPYRSSCILGFHVVGSAQVISIRDQENYQVLEYVTLYCDSLSASAVTNQKGQVEISHFSGSKSIKIRIIGFEQQILSFEEIVAANFQIFMTPSEISLDHLIISE